jgi:hypothetical protein
MNTRIYAAEWGSRRRNAATELVEDNEIRKSLPAMTSLFPRAKRRESGKNPIVAGF